MKKLRLILLTGCFLAFMVSMASAAPILYESLLNVNGAVSDVTLSFPVSGLGSYSVNLSTPGNHYVGLFVDHEVDETTNTWFNEEGAVTGSPSAGQSWEIDEPGWVFGDIWDNFHASSLDNSYPSGSFPDDISMALAWDFTLVNDETATILFTISDSIPGAAFYLSQIDANSNEAIYFSSSLTIEDGGGPGVVIPEPSTMLLLGVGLLGLCASQRRKFFKK